MNNKSNVTIRGLAVPSITLNNCTNIRIVNCKIGPSTIDGVMIYNSTGVTVDSCLLSNVRTGVNAMQSQGIVFSNSQAKNMQGPYPHGQFVQYNNVTGGGNKVLNNKFENILGQSTPEDAISMYQSSGLANDPIVISGNSIRGGGPSHSGGGIMLGDGGGSNIIAENNTLVDPGQYGMAIAGGTNMSVINNNIYGKQQSFTNVGLYYWNQSGKASSNITISGNKINFTNSGGEQNNTYLPNGSLVPTGWSTNVLSKTLTESLLPAVLTSL
ncbi:MAG: right-handed parallel beta-helix repeat-containing protein [Mucilaginibacter sp.]